MSDIENKWVVGVDANEGDPHILIARPPNGELTREDASTLAAHIIATTNTALVASHSPPCSPLAFANLFASTSRSTRPAVPSRSIPSGDALKLAASLLAFYDPECDIVAKVNAVVSAARGGKALDDLLAKEGHEVKLGAPMRSRLDVAPEEETEAEEVAAEALKKMQR